MGDFLGSRLAARDQRDERRDRHPQSSRSSTCHYRAILVLAWFSKGEDTTLLSAGFGVSRTTAIAANIQAIMRPELG